MTRIHDPFTQALEAMRRSAREGDYRPGRPIVIIDEARRLRLSHTPVREALAWLCGEGLVERAPAGGFLAPPLTASGLRDRYAFRLGCLHIALDSAGSWGQRERGGDSLSHWFEGLIESTGNSALVAAFARLEAQLRIVRRAEQRLFTDSLEEAHALRSLSSEADLRAALTAYHHRRMTDASRIVLEVEPAFRADRGSER